jgi:IS30 family transposase
VRSSANRSRVCGRAARYASRGPRSRNRPQGHWTADVVLSQHPAEAEDRAVPGHWEDDLMIGTARSAIGTLVERSSRATLLAHLPRLEGWTAERNSQDIPSSRWTPAQRCSSLTALTVAATDEREHQRPAAPVLPQRHRPIGPVCRRTRSRRSPTQTTGRKVLDWRTPAEVFNEQLHSLQQPGVATTG